MALAKATSPATSSELADALLAVFSLWRKEFESEDDPIPATDFLEDFLAWRADYADVFRKIDDRPEAKIRRAMDLLLEVCNEWDNDSLVHYPGGLPSFGEYLVEIGSKLYAIRWK
jgi:hypothetical protein